jgi:hypothetical protein
MLVSRWESLWCVVRFVYQRALSDEDKLEKLARVSPLNDEETLKEELCV